MLSTLPCSDELNDGCGHGDELVGGDEFGHGGCGVVVRDEGGIGVGEVTLAVAGDGLGRDLATGMEDGTSGNTRNDRGPAQDVRGCGHGHTVDHATVDKQHIRD